MSPTVPARLAWLISCALNQPMRTMLLSSLMSPIPTNATPAPRRVVDRGGRVQVLASPAEARGQPAADMVGVHGLAAPVAAADGADEGGRAARGAHRVLAD